jgi:hypothetical protein
LIPRRLLFPLFLLPISLLGQSATATLQGVITDPAGARIRGARVAAKSTASGLTREAVSDSAGRYAIASLPSGAYELTISRDGFQTYRFTAIRVSVHQRAEFDVQLQLGARTEALTVEVNAAPADGAGAALSGLTSSRQIQDLPLNGRNFAQLLPLQPGVAIISSQGLTGGGPDSAGIQGSGQFVNGARGSVNSFLLDGGDANDPVVPGGTGASSTAIFTGGAPGINGVSADAIEEFRVMTSGAPAEFGRSSGAIIDVVTKSGGNQWHGSAFEYFRNRVLNARNTFEARRPAFTQNNFGGSLGGPLRRNRAFLFGSYEGFRQRQQVSVVNNVPSPNTIAAVGRQNAALGRLLDAWFAGPAAAQPGTFTDRPVEQILQANQPVIGQAVLPRGNGVDQNTGLVRADYNTAGGGRWMVRYQIFEGLGLPGTISGTGIPGSGIGYTNRSQNAVAGWTQAWGSARLNELRLAFQRNSPQSTFEAMPERVLASGPYGAPDSPAGVPTISNLGFGLSPVGYETTAPNRRGVNTFQIADSYTEVRGAHTIKAGFDARRIQENSLFSFRLRPEITYASGGETTILSPGAPFATYDQNVFLTPPTSLRGFRLTEWAAFIQDTWRVASGLTVDAGVRYEYFGRPGEVNGYLNNGFLTANGVEAGAGILSRGPSALNTLRMIPVGPGREFSMYQADRNNFAPRLGIVWKPWGRDPLTIRAGYGIFYDRIFNNVFGNARNSAPYTLLLTLSNAPFGSVPAGDAFTTRLPVGPVTLNPDLRSAYTQRFHWSFQRELAGQVLVEIGYVGARGLNLIRTIRPNQGAVFPADFRPANIDAPARPITFDDYRPLVYGNISTRDASGASTYHALQARLDKRFSNRFALQANYTYGRAVDVASGEILTDLNITTITNRLPVRTADGRIPTPSLALINQVRTSLNEAPFADTTSAARWFNANYTGEGQWRAEIGNAAFDVQHTFVATGSWSLPWGIAANGVIRIQSGVPLTLLTGVDVNGDGNLPDRAALVAGSLDSILAGGNGRQFFRPSTLQNGRRTFDNGTALGVSSDPVNTSSSLKRNGLHGPPLRTADISLMKAFLLRERLTVQARADCFNLLNQTNLANPIANLASPSFGQILGTSTPPRQLQFALRLGF